MPVEARTGVGGSFPSFAGLVGAPEIIYSLGSEEDVILRRTAYLEHEYLYPLVTPPDEVRAILLQVFETVNDLGERPRFYRSVTDNCTGRLERLANALRPGSFPPFMLAQSLPGRTDGVLCRKGWLAADTPPERLRAVYSVRQRANLVADDPDFSRRLREVRREP